MEIVMEPHKRLGAQRGDSLKCACYLIGTASSDVMLVVTGSRYKGF